MKSGCCESHFSKNNHGMYAAVRRQRAAQKHMDVEEENYIMKPTDTY